MVANAARTVPGRKGRGGRSPCLLLSLACLALMCLAACAPARQALEARTTAPSNDPVLTTILRDPRLQGTSVSVTRKDGALHLTGTVRCLAQKIIAEEDAYGVEGVDSVVNEISVQSSGLSDAELARSIVAAIPPPCRRKIQGLEVNVRDMNVTLNGRCKKACYKDLVATVAAFTPGVRSVDNRLRVESCPEGMSATDMRLCSTVRGVLESLPFSTQTVSATVRAGVVTLSGHLDSSKEIEMVESAVRTLPGVAAVKNDISLSPWFSLENPTLEPRASY